MPTAIYKPIYSTWMALYITFVLGIFVWMIGSLIGLPSVFEESYREFPSGLLIVFVVMIVAAASVFVASFTQRKAYGIVAVAIFSAVAVIGLWLIHWALETWDTTTLLMAVIMMGAIAVGFVVEFLARYKSAFVAWLVISILVSVVITNWIYETWGTSLLFYLIILVVIVLYVAVFLSYVLIPKRILGVAT
jgi:hypothetical protein